MKNPNGYGSVMKLSGKRRKPWMVKVTIGFDEKSGKQMQKCIGTFATRPEAIDCLQLYNLSKQNKDLAKGMNPEMYEVVSKKAKIVHTFGECVEAVIERDKGKRSKSWLRCNQMASNLLSELNDRNIAELDLFTLQSVFDKVIKSEKSQETLNKCKVLCKNAFKYAVIHKYIDRNDDYSQYIDATSIAGRTTIHKSFTREEIKMLIDDNSEMSKIVLVYIFTGCRAIELFDIEIYDGYIVCGVKTDSGKGRKIPIHSFIKPFAFNTLKYLNDIKYGTFRTHFAKYMIKMEMYHTLHDTRNTFATLGKEAEMKATAVKKIMGHKIGDLTDDVYTHESIEYLTKEIEKIKIDF